MNRLLEFIHANPGLTQREIGDALGVRNTSNQLTKLENAGRVKISRKRVPSGRTAYAYFSNQGTPK